MTKAGSEAAGSRNSRWILAGIVAWAAISRGLYLSAYRSDPFSSYLIHDAARYPEGARAILSGKVAEPGAFYQAPLYPTLLTAVFRLCGPSLLAGYLLNLVFGILTILLTYRIARRAYGSQAGLAAAGIASLYGTLVFYETKLLPASLTVLLAALLLDRLQAADAALADARWVGAGIVLGLAALASPGLLLVSGVGAAWIALDEARPALNRLLRAAFFLAGAALVVAPVTFRNHAASGNWVLIAANGGITFYQGNNPNALGVFSTPPGFSGSIATQREESRRLAEAGTGRILRDGEVSTFWFRKGLKYLVANPEHWARLLVSKALLSLADEEQPLEYNPRLDENPFRILAPLSFGVLIALAAVRMLERRGAGRGNRAEHPVFLLLLVEGILLLAFYVSGRYRLPAAPGLIALAGSGTVFLARRFREGARRGAAPATTAALVAAFSFAYVPFARATLRDQQDAMGLVDRAEALWGVGRRDECVAALRRSVALDPSWAGSRLNLGRALRDLGNPGEAERSIREALRLDPGSMEARFDLGVLCVMEGRFQEAAAYFEEVRRVDPGNANAANNLLGVLIHLVRTERARELWREMKAQGLAVDPSLDQKMIIDDGGDKGRAAPEGTASSLRRRIRP